jgi:hypothetical protein
MGGWTLKMVGWLIKLSFITNDKHRACSWPGPKSKKIMFGALHLFTDVSLR